MVAVNLRFFPETPVGGTSVTIEERRPDIMVAPAQVWMKATNIVGLNPFNLTGLVYEGEFHEYFYYWEVRGQPLAPFSSPENMITEWNNPNVMGGQEVGFCLTDPGSYIIDLMVVDKQGVTAVAESMPITVLSMEDQYPLSDRVYVSFAGDFSEVPVGGVTASTRAQLDAAVLANGSSNTALLINRGEVYEEFRYINSDQKRCSYIGAYGSAATKPILRPEYGVKQSSIMSITSGVGLKTVVTTGLRFEGDWDVTNESGSWGSTRGLDTSQLGMNNASLMFHDLEFEGLNISLLVGQRKNDNAINNRFMVADVSITGWKDYGLFCFKAQTDLIAVLGNKLVQNVDAVNGGQKTVSFMNNHGPTRFADVKGVYMSMNDIFSRTGWSGLDQQCLRYTTTGIDGQWTYTDRNVMEGGYLMVSLQGANGGEDDRPGNHLFERNLLIGTCVTNSPNFGVHKGGTVVRGNYLYSPNNIWANANSGLKTSFNFSADNDEGGNEFEPNAAFGNTVVIERDDTNTGTITGYGLLGSNSFVNPTFDADNVLHVPNLTGGDVSSAPFDATVDFSGVTLRYKGVRVGFEPVPFDIPSGGLAIGATISVPYTEIHQRLAAKLKPSTQTTNVNGELDTDQAYWLANPPTDSRHSMSVAGFGPLGAHLGHFSVVFGATTVDITNTSTFDWIDPNNVAAVIGCRLKLDRTSRIPAMDTTYAQDGQTVPMYVPTGASTAVGTASGVMMRGKSFINGDPLVGPINQGAI